VTPPEALILAGPNGAGKTTASAWLVPEGTQFLNSDLIAARLLEEGHPTAGIEVAAGRVVLGELRTVIAAQASFCIETNLAGRGLIRRINEWRGSGYGVRLAFTALDSPEIALRRVAIRVSQGGHDVPEYVVRRRWAAGLRSLFDLYLPLVDQWIILDSSDGPLQLVAESDPEDPALRVTNIERWRRLLRLAAAAGALATRPGGEFFDPVAPVDDNGDSET
jgi:predicted ABC-type ATPase